MAKQTVIEFEIAAAIGTEEGEDLHDKDKLSYVGRIYWS